MVRKLIYVAALSLATLLTIGSFHQDAETMCVLFPPGGRDIFGVSQRNIIIFDDGRVSLIPQVQFEGDARDFGIVVPVPGLPELATVNGSIFAEASFLTQPVVRRSNRGCSCDDEVTMSPIFGARAVAENARVDETGNGVTIIYEDIVGTYQAVVLQATQPAALTTWLNDNGYHYNPADSTVLAGYVQQNWYFVAMKLDTSQVPPQIDLWWNAVTSPAKISFPHEADGLTYPLKISAISTNEKAEILVYTIADDPMRFSGARVEYANQIDRDELSAISGSYPALSQFLFEGRFLTKLRRTFRRSEMQQDVIIQATDDRREYREIRYSDRGGFQFAGLLLLVLIIRSRRRFLR